MKKPKYVPCSYCGFHPDAKKPHNICGTCFGKGVTPEKAAAYQLLQNSQGYLSAAESNELHSIDWEDCASNKNE